MAPSRITLRARRGGSKTMLQACSDTDTARSSGGSGVVAGLWLAEWYVVRVKGRDGIECEVHACCEHADVVDQLGDAIGLDVDDGAVFLSSVAVDDIVSQLDCSCDVVHIPELDA